MKLSNYRGTKFLKNKKKTVYSLFCVVFCSLFLYNIKAQALINGSIINSDDIVSLKLIYSKQGFFSKERELDIVIENNAFMVNVSLEQDAVAWLKIEQKHREAKKISLYLQDKTTLLLSFDAKDAWKTITFKGKLQADNEHLKVMSNGNGYPSVYEGKGKNFAKDTVAKTCYEKLMQAKDTEIKDFIKIAKEKKLSKLYIKYAKQEIETYYSHLLNNIASMHFFNNFRGNSKIFTEQGWDKLSVEKIKPVIESKDKDLLRSYHVVSIKNPRLNGFWAYFFDVVAKPEEINPQAMEAGTYYKRLEKKLIEVYQGDFLEVQYADFLLGIEMQKKYEVALIDMIDNFCKEFPNSVYIEKLTLAKKEVENYHEQKNKPIADDIKIIEKYNEITKFLDVLEKFKGKAVFVDLWGSWCGPCKKEFAYMPELKEYFKDKNLAYLYIANEQNSPNKEEKWLNMIKLHHLTGYHLIANKELLTDIWKQVATISDEELVNLDEGDKDVMQHIKAGKTQSYPTYLIINEKGEIIFKHAFKPSTKQKLYKQIEKVLEK